MSRRVAAVVVVLIALVVLALLLPLIQKARLNASLVASRNNLKDLTFFAAHHSNPDPRPAPPRLPGEVPAATVVLGGVPAENRLSWAVAVLPGLDQKKHPTDQLLAQLRLDQPWDA